MKEPKQKVTKRLMVEAILIIKGLRKIEKTENTAPVARWLKKVEIIPEIEEMQEAVVIVRKLEGARKIKEPVLAIRDLRKEKKTEELMLAIILLLS